MGVLHKHVPEWVNSNNSIYNNSWSGLVLHSSSSNDILGNSIFDNIEKGIYLNSSASYINHILY